MVNFMHVYIYIKITLSVDVDGLPFSTLYSPKKASHGKYIQLVRVGSIRFCNCL
jgi:hypothetical protein